MLLSKKNLAEISKMNIYFGTNCLLFGNFNILKLMES